MKKGKNNYFDAPWIVYAADFETTTDNPQKVEVWSAAEIAVDRFVPSEDRFVQHQSSIDDFMKWAQDTSKFMKANMKIYFHNLKFDGHYILDWLLKKKKMLQWSGLREGEVTLLDHEGAYTSNMPKNNFTYNIDSKNVMYTITVNFNGYFIEFNDSLKLLPFALKKIAKDFQTKHKKLEMDFSGKYPGYEPTNEEMEYIRNDVFVLKEALEKVAEISGIRVDELPKTISQQAMQDFCLTNGFYTFTKDGRYKYKSGPEWERLFPKQTEVIKGAYEGAITFDDYCRAAYRGGWCYVKDEWRGKVITFEQVFEYLLTVDKKVAKRLKKNYIGYVYDVNSLYPSVMHSKSDCFYPVGDGVYTTGLPKEWEEGYRKKEKYYFLHVQMEFELKEGYLPCLQIKNCPGYKSTEWLKTSDIVNIRTGERTRGIADVFLTCTDWEMVKKHYVLKNVRIISSLGFSTAKGFFDKFIDKWMKIKQNSTGAMRAWAKLHLNSCYGKFATAPLASYQVCYVNEGKVCAETVLLKDESRAVYIPVGAAITSWARNFTISHAQKNYHRFCYADTDSLHMIGNIEDAKNIKEDAKALCCWKNETKWDKAIFAGQKRYIEHVIEKDGEGIEPEISIKCCGMAAGCREILAGMLEAGRYAACGEVKEDFGYEDFKEGLVVPGNLKGHIVEGGIFLEEKDFHFR